jgi:hypothetical protein
VKVLFLVISCIWIFVMLHLPFITLRLLERFPLIDVLCFLCYLPSDFRSVIPILVHVIHILSKIMSKQKRQACPSSHLLHAKPLWIGLALQYTIMFELFSQKLKGAVVVVVVWQLHLQLPVQSVPTTTNVVSSNPAYGEVYSIQHYVIKVCQRLALVFFVFLHH